MSIIYLDNCATTACKREITFEMMKYFSEEFGNPSSQHAMGKRSKHAINLAVNQVAKFIGSSPDEIILTSGATESNNLVLLGAFDVHDSSPTNAIFCPTDHKSSLDVAKELSRRGIKVKYLEVKNNGQICLESLKRSLDHNTRILSIAYVNSEIGTIQNIEKIARICNDNKVILHVDAVQAVGKIHIKVKELGINALSLSAHKIYGPKGVGALYVESNLINDLRPLIFGGGQNRLRSGTLPTPLIVGLGLACEIAGKELYENYSKTMKQRDYFIHKLHQMVEQFYINTDLNVSVPYILNIQFPNISSETLVTGLRDVAISSGSACNSDSLEPSYVLTNIGLTKDQANNSIRICLNPNLTIQEIDTAIYKISEKISSIKSVSTY